MKWVRLLAVIAGLAAVAYFLPVFHVVPLSATREQAAADDFDPTAFVDELWDGALGDAVANAVDASGLLDALREDPAAATGQFGRRLGLGGSTYYLVSAEGTIASIEPSAIVIALDDTSDTLRIETGPVFGNAIRDGSGLLDVSRFPNAQEFNAISAEINRRVEERVLPELQAGAETGRQIRVAGGIELADSGGVPSTLTLVPVRVEFP